MTASGWQNAVEWLRLYSQLRQQLMDVLEPGDLHFKLPGDNPSLGEQCLIIGEIQKSYIDSFENFTQDFEYKYPDSTIAHDLNGLIDWYTALDEQLFSRLTGMSKNAIENQKIDRGDDFTVAIKTQMDIYREALVIFYGKVSVYLKAMGKELPGRWAHWIE